MVEAGARLSLANALHLRVLTGEGVWSTFCPDKYRLPEADALLFLCVVI